MKRPTHLCVSCHVRKGHGSRHRDEQLCEPCQSELQKDFPCTREGDPLRVVRAWDRETAAKDLIAANEVALLNGMFEYRELPIRRVTQLPEERPLRLSLTARKVDSYMAREDAWWRPSK